MGSLSSSNHDQEHEHDHASTEAYAGGSGLAGSKSITSRSIASPALLSPYSYIASRSCRAGSPTFIALTLDTGHTSTDTIMTAERKLVVSGLPPVWRAAWSRAGSVVRKTGGLIVYEDGLEHDKNEEYEYIYEDPGQPLVPRTSAPTKQGGSCTSRCTRSTSMSTKARVRRSTGTASSTTPPPRRKMRAGLPTPSQRRCHSASPIPIPTPTSPSHLTRPLPLASATSLHVLPPTHLCGRTLSQFLSGYVKCHLIAL